MVTSERMSDCGDAVCLVPVATVSDTSAPLTPEDSDDDDDGRCNGCTALCFSCCVPSSTSRGFASLSVLSTAQNSSSSSSFPEKKGVVLGGPVEKFEKPDGQTIVSRQPRMFDRISR